ncbi:hypothetical protein Droror1_Dr00024081, partial [Drosera rotundifolia]
MDSFQFGNIPEWVWMDLLGPFDAWAGLEGFRPSWILGRLSNGEMKRSWVSEERGNWAYPLEWAIKE